MPDHTGRVEAIATRLGRSPEPGTEPPTWWYRPSEPATDDAARASGLAEVRRLHQMRRPLPLEPPLSEEAELDVRAFAPERDVKSWLEVNNRAFGFHPDQGGWSPATLEERMSEPWFDPSDHLVHEDAAGRLDGFCWTKVHPGDPELGEIYVIGVDPSRHGTGLGRALVIAGLRHLWRRHRTPVGMLYVEADNHPALRLYRRLGFTVHHDDAAFALLDDAPRSL